VRARRHSHSCCLPRRHLGQAVSESSGALLQRRDRRASCTRCRRRRRSRRRSRSRWCRGWAWRCRCRACARARTGHPTCRGARWRTRQRIMSGRGRGCHESWQEAGGRRQGVARAALPPLVEAGVARNPSRHALIQAEPSRRALATHLGNFVGAVPLGRSARQVVAPPPCATPPRAAQRQPRSARRQ
jgi:hypothetical protein